MTIRGNQTPVKRHREMKEYGAWDAHPCLWCKGASFQIRMMNLRMQYVRRYMHGSVEKTDAGIRIEGNVQAPVSMKLILVLLVQSMLLSIAGILADMALTGPEEYLMPLCIAAGMLFATVCVWIFVFIGKKKYLTRKTRESDLANPMVSLVSRAAEVGYAVW